MRSGWTTATLGDVCSYEKQIVNDLSLPYLGMEHIESGTGKICNPLEPSDTKSSSFYFCEDHVLYGRLRPYLNKVALPATSGRCSTEIFPLRPSADITREFLFYWLIRDDSVLAINRTSTGTRMPRANMKEVADLPFSYPSLDEQRRITTFLNDVFDDIEKVSTLAKRSLTMVQDLFDSVLSQSRGEEQLLGELVDIQTGKLNANAAIEGGRYPFFTCARQASRINTVAFDCEAVLLAGNNAVGDFNVKHYSGKFNAYQRTYVITVAHDAQITYRYLYYQLLKSLAKFKTRSVGTGTKFLKLGVIKGMAIPVPPLNEQESITATLDTYQSQTERLAQLYSSKIQLLSELKQSFLRRAFSGDLFAAKEIAA